MKPPLTVQRIMPFLAEAAHRLSYSSNLNSLAEEIVEHYNNPARFRKDERQMAVFNRAIASEFLDYTRCDLETDMARNGYCIWVAVTFRTAQSCRLAQETLSGKIFEAGQPLPVLPLNDCPAMSCHCSYHPLSRSDLRRASPSK